MPSRAFIEAMPKVELHVHVEGSIRPETVLRLAAKNGIDLPAKDLDGLKEWYRFRDFPHFVEVYVAVSKCVKSAEDLAFVLDEFAAGQAAQNVLHTEATFTASTLARYSGIPYDEQRDVLREAHAAAPTRHGVSVSYLIDIVRGDTIDGAQEVLDFARSLHGQGVCALGLAGEEKRGGAKDYREVLERAEAAGIPFVPHAGETVGPESIWDVLEHAKPVRIGHGVRAIEDPKLVHRLVETGIPLEVSPHSNVCLGVFPRLADHSLPKLMDAGVVCTINSDDPPMFGSTLTDDWERTCHEFDFSADIAYSLTLNAANAALLSPDAKRALIATVRDRWPSEDEDEDVSDE